MRDAHIQGLAGLAVAVLAATTVAMAEGDPRPFPDEARKRLDYAIGKWRSETQFLDPEGNVRSTQRSEDRREFIIDDRVVEISGVINDGAQTFRAWEYYDVQEGKYTLTSVDRNGQLWSMKGDLAEVFRWTAERTARDGSTFLMRFTHHDVTAGSFTAVGEISKDGGRTWTTFSRQFMTRIEE